MNNEKKKWDKRERASGRFERSVPCDACGEPVGAEYLTDEEVCGLTDGPGFFLCQRIACIKRRRGTVEQRREFYETTRRRLEK